MSLDNVSDRSASGHIDVGDLAFLRFEVGDIDAVLFKRGDHGVEDRLVQAAAHIDDIEIIHTAHNRTGFATGAVLAAEFIHNKKGIFTMKDVLAF